jgi:hypothetical protein
MPWGFLWALPADFTLLPSGDLYLLGTSDDSGHMLLTTRLPRQATCHLLNSIDQAGFFDYDPASYPGWGPTDMGSTSISVHAWRANSVGLYNFAGALREETQYQATGTPLPAFPTILPAIRATYRLLDQYDVPPGALHPLKPERLGVWLLSAREPAGAKGYVEWPLSSHTLAALGLVPGNTYGGGGPSMILTGEDATQVYDALGEGFSINGITVREGDKLYQAFARPLLPNELEWLAVWFSAPRRPSATREYVEWPLTSHTIAAAGPPAGQAWNYPVMILTGEDAARVYNALRAAYDTDGTFFREGDKLYLVDTQVLMPGGELLRSGELGSFSLPEVPMRCYPSDGWMQAP